MKHFFQNLPTWFYYLLLVVAAAIWGLGTVVIKSAVDVFPPAWLVAFRFGTASLAFAVLFFKPIMKHFNKQTVTAGISIGIATGLAYIFNTVGLTDTTASNSSFIMGTSCIIVPFLAWAFMHIKPTKFNITAAILCVIGIGFVALQGTSGITLRWGDGITVFSALAVAAEITITSHVARGKNLFALTFWQFLTSCVLATILGVFTEPLPALSLFTSETIASIAYLGLAGSCITIALQNIGLAHVRPAPGALFLSTEILFGVWFSVLFLGEQLSGSTYLGALLIGLSIVISEYLPEAPWFYALQRKLLKVFKRDALQVQGFIEEVPAATPYECGEQHI